MFITSLTLRNFRNFRASRFHFEKGINTLIGENGSGKTNVFQALRIMLDGTMPRNIKLFESDFNRSLDNWRGHWIVISLEFDELDNSDECQSLAVHAVGDAADNKGTYSFLFRPRREVRKQLFDYSETEDKDAEGLVSLLDTITLEQYEAVFRGKGTIDFADEVSYLQHVGDFESIVFPDPESEDNSILGDRLPNEISLPSEISCTFVKALRDVEAELKSYQSSPLLNLLRDKDKKVATAGKTEILDDIKNLNTRISGLDEVKSLSSDIVLSVQGAVGHTYAPNVDIRSEIPDDVDRLFQSLKLWVGDPDEANHLGRLWELSLGGVNLIYLSLRLLEYEKLRSENRAAHFLFIEEPEAHIHTHIQKSLFKNVPQNKTQVIVSTHSTHISSASKISSVNILSRNNGYADVFYPANNLGDKVDAIERYLDAVRSTLLFAKGVVMVEGDAEQILIPEMFLRVFGVSLDEMGVSLVNIGSTGFENLAVLFHEDRIKRNCTILTDSDTISVDEADCTPEDWVKYQNSQKSGFNRVVILDDVFNDNTWVNVNYASHTFEVDFLRVGNKDIVKKVIHDIYEREADRNSSIAKIDDTDSKSNHEILRLAKKVGKGWFAILLAKHLDWKVAFPDYILEAVAFAVPSMPLRMQAGIADYRIQKMCEEAIPQGVALRGEFPKLEELKTSERLSEFVARFVEVFPNDPLAHFAS
ncbi:MAG: AAA family ATPase [Lewinellaceae bacterium]|nr:AAA family ATPase [Saprospiraceae bacterium]MCB9341778.1 AAA family ATPase [Lewinellaceae bacterium]